MRGDPIKTLDESGKSVQALRSRGAVRHGRRGQVRVQAHHRKAANADAVIGAGSLSRSTSHSAMPRRVQYLRGDGGGRTSIGGASASAR
jgi:hypothetical protein